jgi:hypothetical protein
VPQCILDQPNDSEHVDVEGRRLSLTMFGRDTRAHRCDRCVVDQYVKPTVLINIRRELLLGLGRRQVRARVDYAVDQFDRLAP